MLFLVLRLVHTLINFKLFMLMYPMIVRLSGCMRLRLDPGPGSENESTKVT